MPGVEEPVYFWVPSIAPSGMTFYTGDLFPEWKGNLFVGAMAGQRLVRLVLNGERVVAEEAAHRPEAAHPRSAAGAGRRAVRVRRRRADADHAEEIVRRSASFAAAALAALLLLQPARAAGAAFGPITLAVPEGFVAAPAQRQDNMSVWAWTKSAPGGKVKALLQVSVYDFGSRFAQLPREELGNGAEKYLRDFLGGVERRRTNYLLSPVKRVQISGAPAAVATWTGRAGPADLIGVMYCVIVRNRFVVSFHTQDLGSEPSTAMYEAISAIESAQFPAAP